MLLDIYYISNNIRYVYRTYNNISDNWYITLIYKLNIIYKLI